MLNDNNINYITFDFTGHGYSDGEKGYINNSRILIDDVIIILLYLYNNKFIHSNMSFFIMGHSMGGGVAIAISDLLTYGEKSIIKSQLLENNMETLNKIILSFGGLILLAPLIKFNHQDSLSKVNYYLSKILSNIPTFIFDENKYNDKIWKNKKYREYIEFDGNLFNKNSISYGNNIKFKTLSSFYELSNLICDRIHFISCPFIVLYDSYKDIIISKNSIDLLMNNSISKNKEYIHIEDGLHDPLANEQEIVMNYILSWLKKQLIL